ncbi:MAG: GEVED domain-containing protein, partial [Phycisphaerae bacterium]|nr:GEVED domain-containing protein [Phycisphaerae bacterium]
MKKKLAILLLLTVCTFTVQAVVIPQPPVLNFDKTATGTIPDLNQKRDYDGDSNPEAKWCAPTASADSVWYYGSGSYPLLIPAGANDPAKADTLISTLGGLMGTSDASGGTTTTNCVNGLQAYYNSKYPGAFGVSLVTAWTFPDGGGQPSAKNLWNWMTNNLYDCNDVLPIISYQGAPTSESGIPDILDSVNGHLVMMIGYNYPTPNPDTITIYDPGDAAVGGAHAFPPGPPNPAPVTYTLTPVGTSPEGTALDTGTSGFIVGAIISGPLPENGTGELDFGDAPEGSNAMAYPSLGVTGQFPTCITVGPAGWIQHTNFGAYFGPLVDFETDGNAGLCPSGTCFPPYDQDECFQDGDAGLIMPDSFTIDNALNVVTCTGIAPGTSLGQTCATAVWGTDIDIDVTNTMPNQTVGYVNVLVDWDQNGSWGGSATGACTAPEYVLVDFAVPNGHSGPLSTLMAANTSFIIGPNPGYVWVRFSITEYALQNPTWDGSGSFEDGETEDYLLKVDPSPPPNLKVKFQQLPLDGLTIEQTPYYGHDELSTAYKSTDPGTLFEGCYMADDFADLEHSPVIKVKWWGSYIENEIMEPVDRFLIAFEGDIPAQGHPDDADYVASHPAEPILTQFVHRAAALPLNPGEFSETYLNAGGPPCNEALYEYEAVLENPFGQDPNTVYWIKIVAIIDNAAAWGRLNAAVQNSGLGLCEFLKLPYASGDPNQIQFGLQTPVTRWGWHNRDYTQVDPYASTPPAVNPGEHNPRVYVTTLPAIPGLADTDVWHFQDDAVSGDIVIDEAAPEMPAVNQPTWQEEFYQYTLPYCQGSQGVDGPEGIDAYSKDLAFELWTNNDCFPSTKPDYSEWVLVGKPTSWCTPTQCHGDANGTTEVISKVVRQVGYQDINILVAGFNK